MVTFLVVMFFGLVGFMWGFVEGAAFARKSKD